MNRNETDRDDPALDAHIVFFDVDGDGDITASEIKTALVELGFSKVLSAVLAPALALALPSSVAEIRDVRHDDSGAFDKDGRFDEAAFDTWWGETDTDASGGLTRWELLLGSARIADDASSLVASLAEFQLLHSLLAENGALSRAAIEDFLNGDLFRRLIALRTTERESDAPDEIRMHPPTIDSIRDFIRLTVHHRGEAADAYDDAALGYDLFADVWDRTVARTALERFEEILIERVPAGGVVLDVGAGTGRRTQLILDRTEPSRVVALDSSSGMLEQARKKIDDPRVEFVHGSALDLPFDDDTFDVVCSTWLLSILDAPRVAVSEWRRVLKPGGTMVMAFCSLPEETLGDLVDWIARNIATTHNPLTHTVPIDKQPLHDCDRASVERFFGGFTSVVCLGKCCDVSEPALPCVMRLP